MTTDAKTFSPWAKMTERQILDGHLKFCQSIGAFSRLALGKIGIIMVERPNVPDWFIACFEAYWKTAWNKIPVGVTEDSVTSQQAGFAMGYMRWMCDFIDKLEAKMKELNWPMPELSVGAQTEMDKAWRDAICPPEMKPTFDLFESGEADKELEAVEGVVDSIPIPEAVQFYHGKSKGLLGPSGRSDGELASTDATVVYSLLMLFWPVIIDMQSVSVLHRFLTLFLGKNRAGNKDRTTKLCLRIGLKLRGRGRPKKAWPFKPRKKRRKVD